MITTHHGSPNPQQHPKKNKKKSHPQIPNAPCNVYGISTYIYHKLKLYINWSFKCNLGKWFQSHGAFIGKFQEIHGNPCSLVRFLLAWHQDVGSSVPAATSVVRVQAVWLVDWTTQLKKKCQPFTRYAISPTCHHNPRTKRIPKFHCRFVAKVLLQKHTRGDMMRLYNMNIFLRKTPTYPWSIPQESLNPQMKRIPS